MENVGAERIKFSDALENGIREAQDFAKWAHQLPRKAGRYTDSTGVYEMDDNGEMLRLQGAASDTAIRREMMLSHAERSWPMSCWEPCPFCRGTGDAFSTDHTIHTDGEY